MRCLSKAALAAIVFLGFASTYVLSAQAQDQSDLHAAGAALAKQKNCMACHQVDSRRVGPPFASVAKRYVPAESFRDSLAESIRVGGRGKWSAVPMPAQPHVSEAEALQMADWILSLNPAKP